MTGPRCFLFLVSLRVDSYLFVIVFAPKLRIFIDIFSFTFKDATAEESLELRMSNRDFRPSHSQMIEMLKEADLESHGYEKQVTSSLTQVPGSDEKSYERTHLYYKIVSCSQLQEIYQEIHRLLPGK